MSRYTDAAIDALVAHYVAQERPEPLTAREVAGLMADERATPNVVGRALSGAFNAEGWTRIEPVAVYREEPASRDYPMMGTRSRKVQGWQPTRRLLCALVRARGEVAP